MGITEVDSLLIDISLDLVMNDEERSKMEI